MQVNPVMFRTETTADDERHVAMGYIADAFAEARLDGLDEACIVQAAVFTAFLEMVNLYGEEETAAFALKLSERARSGEFTLFRNSH